MNAPIRLYNDFNLRCAIERVRDSIQSLHEIATECSRLGQDEQAEVANKDAEALSRVVAAAERTLE